MGLYQEIKSMQIFAGNKNNLTIISGNKISAKICMKSSINRE